MDQAKFSICVQTIAHRIHCGPWAMLYVLKPQNDSCRLISNHETQNLAFRLQQERAKSDRIKNQLLVPQEKVPAIIKFKPQTFVLSTLKDIVLPKKKHPTSRPSNLGFYSFLPKKNLFFLSKTTPTNFDKENSFILPFLFSSSPLSTITVPVTTATVSHIADDVSIDDAAATVVVAREAYDRTTIAHIAVGITVDGAVAVTGVQAFVLLSSAF